MQVPGPLLLPAIDAEHSHVLNPTDEIEQALRNTVDIIEAQISLVRWATKQKGRNGTKPPYYERLLGKPVFVGEFFCVPLSKVLLDLAMLGTPSGGLAVAIRAIVKIGGTGPGNRLEVQVQELLIYQRKYYKKHMSTGYGKGGNARLAQLWNLLTLMGSLLGISPCCYLHFALETGILGGTGIVSTGEHTTEGNPLLHAMILVGADCSDPTTCVLEFLDQSNSNATVHVTIGNPPSFDSEGSIIGTVAGMSSGSGRTQVSMTLQTVLVIIA